MSTKRLILFISFVSIVTLFVGAFVGYKLITQSRFSNQTKTIFWVLHSLGILSIIIGPFIYRIHPTQEAGFLYQGFQWFHYVLMGFYSFLFLFTFSSEILVWLSDRFHFTDGTNIERRGFLNHSISLGTFGVSTALTSFALIRARMTPWLNEVTIPFKDLPEILNGKTFVQISDLHVGPTIKKDFVEKVVAIANSCNPDFVCLTGDFVDGSIDQLRADVAPLALLNANFGRFYITGNHEYYSGPEEWMTHFRSLGFTGLENEHQLFFDGALAVGGVRDLKCNSVMPEHVSDPVAAFAGAPKDAFRFLLAHQPGSYVDAIRAGVKLQISGHTHGGQFFPWNLAVKLVHRFSLGLYEHEGMKIFVNGGTGYWGPPLRLGVRSEITLIRLVKA